MRDKERKKGKRGINIEKNIHQSRERKTERERDKNMVLNLLRHHHHDKYIHVLVTVYSQQYQLYR